MSPIATHQYCGARTRRGGACVNHPVSGKRRCRMHGGALGSGAQRGNQNALKHGRFTKEQIELRRAARYAGRDYDQEMEELMAVADEFEKGHSFHRDAEVLDTSDPWYRLSELQLSQLSELNSSLLAKEVALRIPFDPRLQKLADRAIARNRARCGRPMPEILDAEEAAAFVEEIGGLQMLPACLSHIDERPDWFKMVLALCAAQYKVLGIVVAQKVAHQATRVTLGMLWERVHTGKAPIDGFEMAILHEAIAAQRGPDWDFWRTIDHDALKKCEDSDRGFVMFQQAFPPPDDFAV